MPPPTAQPRRSPRFQASRTVTLTPAPTPTQSPPSSPSSSSNPPTPKYTFSGLDKFFPASSPSSQGGEGSSSSRTRNDTESTLSADEAEFPDEMLEALDLIKADETAGWQHVLPKNKRRHKLIKKRVLAVNAINNLSNLITGINYYRKHQETEPKWSTQKWVNFILTGDPEWTLPTEPYVEVDCSPPLIIPNFAPAPVLPAPAPAPNIANPAIPEIEPAVIHPAPAAEEEEDEPAWATPPASPPPGPVTPSSPLVEPQEAGPAPGPSGLPTPSTTSPTVGPTPLPLTAAQRAAGVVRVQEAGRVLTTLPDARIRPTLADRMESIRTSHPIQYATRQRLEREGLVIPGDIVSNYLPTRKTKKP